MRTSTDEWTCGPVRFEFAAKDASINMRLPADLLAAVKRRAEQERITYQRFSRQALEGAVGKGEACVLVSVTPNGTIRSSW